MLDRRMLATGLLLLLLPAVLDAQRTRRRGGDANWDEITKTATPTVLTVKEVEAMDPIRHLIAKRKDLKLSDAQFAQLKAMDDSGKARDAALLATMDSLRREMRPQGQMDDIQRLRLQVVRREFTATVVRIRANYDADAAAVLPALEESQRPAAEALLAKQKAEADKVVEEKLGGRPGGGAATRRP
jgi:hypothetical protein